MSTVNKGIADRIIAGEFAEDHIVAIIKYNNVFNYEEAYKIIPYLKKDSIQWILDGKIGTMLNPTLYWRKT